MGVDARPFPGILSFNYAEGIPCPDGWLEAIEISHSLEHLSHAKTLNILRECYRALMPSGFIEIVVPHDAFWYHVNLIQYYLSRDYNPDVLYGKQTNDFDYHRTGFTKTKLRRLLEKSGFAEVEVRAIGKSDIRSPEHQWRKFTLGWWVDNFICKSQLFARGVKVATKA